MKEQTLVGTKKAETRVWREVLRRAAAALTPKEYETWLRPLVCRRAEDLELVLEVPNARFRDFLVENYHGLLEAKAAEVLAPGVKVILETPDGQEGLFASGAGTPDVAAKGAPTPPTKLNPLYTFDTFVVGRSNSFCHAASRAVAQDPGVRYNPLFVYGGVGLGKTHLMHAVGHAALANGRNLRVSYLSCDYFMNEMIAAVKNNKTDAFRRKYRNVDFLLVDDVQFLAGMEGTQLEFFHTFNALYETRRQIVLSSDRAPKDIPELEERLRTRFECGLTADIQPPDYETRRAIIAKKAEVQGIKVPDSVADLIATRITTNIRAIEGVLTRLAAAAALSQSPVDVTLAQEIIREIAPEGRRVSLSLDQLQEVTAKYFNLTRRDLISKTRRAHIARARQISMYICREKTTASLSDIGLAFGNRDHTTVLYSIAKIEGEVTANAESTLKVLADLETNISRLSV